MISFKRPRAQPPNEPSSNGIPMVAKCTSRAFVSVCLCLLMTGPSSMKMTQAFTVSGPSLAAYKPTSTPILSPLFATSSTTLSSMSNDSVKESKPALNKSKEANLLLFKTYNEYKSIQERILSQNLSDYETSEQAEALNLSQATLETILVNGYNARQTLLLDNIPLVHYTVKKVAAQKLNSLSREDLIQEGTIGLIKAIDKFDASLGNAFSTYAVYWIKASVLRCIQQREDMIRVPEYLERAIRAVDAYLKDKGQIDWNSKDLYASVDVDDVVQYTGHTPRTIKEAMKVKQRRVLQASRKEGYSELQDYMFKGAKFQQQNESGHFHIREGQLDHFKDILGQFLSIKEMEAISWRYGLLQEAAFNIPEPVQVDIRQSRDYEAEAEDDIFGAGGILSVNSGSVSSTVNARTQKGKAPTAKITFATKKPTPIQSKGGRWGEAMSFKEVGENMRVSAEYGRRLCSSAMKKLQTAAEDGRLDPAMLF